MAPMSATELVLALPTATAQDPTALARLMRLAPPQTPALFRVAAEGSYCRVYYPKAPPGLFPDDSRIRLEEHAWPGYRPTPDFYALGLALTLGGGA